jgi:hypothetical protein
MSNAQTVAALLLDSDEPAKQFILRTVDKRHLGQSWYRNNEGFLFKNNFIQIQVFPSARVAWFIDKIENVNAFGKQTLTHLEKLLNFMVYKARKMKVATIHLSPNIQYSYSAYNALAKITGSRPRAGGELIFPL